MPDFGLKIEENDVNVLNLNEFYLNVTGISFTFFTINLQKVVLNYVKLALADVGNISKQTP